MSESIGKTDSYCNPPKRDIYELDKEIRRQLYIETAKNEKILGKIHRKILSKFYQFDDHNLVHNNNPSFTVEKFSNANADISSKLSCLFTEEPLDCEVISSIAIKYTPLERCQLIAEMFEKKYPDFPLMLECEHQSHDRSAYDKDVRLRARINRKDL